MQRPDKDTYYCTLARAVGSRATCPRRKVGCIITDKNGLLLASGYNGPPRALPHCTETPCEGTKDPPGNTTNCIAVHAEQNALLQLGDRIERASVLYTTAMPCFTCTKLICQTGIKRVVYMDEYPDMRALTLLIQAGIEVKKHSVYA